MDPDLNSCLSDRIRDEIRRTGGSVPFARFMELALYAGGLGYYERPRRVGRDGDFFTSVSVGSLLGQLIAHEALACQQSGRGPLVMVEAGANDGQLAMDILDAISEFDPGAFQSVRYLLLEPSDVRRSWQQSQLARFGSQVEWLSGPDRLKEWFENRGLEAAEGFFIANELLDAFPVDVLRWNAAEKQWFERRVAHSNEGFCWVDGSVPVVPVSLVVPRELADVLPDGFQVEVCDSAVSMWRRIAAVPSIRRLMTLDYGYGPGEEILPKRPDGTLRGYKGHRVTRDVLAEPGTQDITAHVNFSRLIAAGEAEGLKTVFFGSQERWVGSKFVSLAEHLGNAWVTAERIRQFHTLSRPDQLGRAFRVLVQDSCR